MHQIPQMLLDLAVKVEDQIKPATDIIQKQAFLNHQKVLNAFAAHKVSDYHLKGSTGYGYGDQGREILEKVFAQVLGTEAALVRSQIVSGTHAIAIALFGVLRPGDELLSVTGRPYDTLEELIGLKGKGTGSLKDWGVTYNQVELLPEGTPDLAAIAEAISEKTKVVTLQRSRGYSWRSSLTIKQLAKTISVIKSIKPETIIFVDNCYGELVELQEPTDVGADLIAGSLIKNLGGGLAPTGGYLAGRQQLIDLAANRLTSPGIGAEVGASLDLSRHLFQGLFMAPHTVSEALQGAIFTACLFTELGFEVSPKFNDYRTDLIQAIKLGSGKLVQAFCLGLQQASPIDSHVTPEPWDMPGYEDQVIMAGGTFVQGATIELSADAPMREPYAIYFQGGLCKEHVKLGALLAAAHVLNSK